MFQNITDNNEEKSFSDAYRSEILNNNSNKEEGTLFKKLIFILLLMVLISAVSIFGYKYLNSSPSQNSTTINENKPIDSSPIATPSKKVIEEQKKEPLPTESMMIDNFEDLEIIEPAKVSKVEPTPTAIKNDIDNIAEQMKLELSKELDKKSTTYIEEDTPNSTLLTPQGQKGEELYMKQLADLSREIDGETK